MDPNIWGPVVWATIFDVSWSVCQLPEDTRASKELKTAINLFFKSLQFLLPCRFCRESYVEFLAEMGGAPPIVTNARCNRISTLKWAYDLKNKVNKKLDATLYPPFEKIEQRMKTYHSIGSGTNTMDMLFIMAENYDADLDTDKQTRLNKQVWYFILIRCLTELSAYMPPINYGAFHETFAANPIRIQDVANKQSVMSYLCGQFKSIGSKTNTKLKIEDACKKYGNARPLSKKNH